MFCPEEKQEINYWQQELNIRLIGQYTDSPICVNGCNKVYAFHCKDLRKIPSDGQE